MLNNLLMKTLNIRKIRDELGLTREEFAKKLGACTPRAVKSWELGARDPSRAMRALIEQMTERAAAK